VKEVAKHFEERVTEDVKPERWKRIESAYLSSIKVAGFVFSLFIWGLSLNFGVSKKRIRFFGGLSFPRPYRKFFSFWGTIRLIFSFSRSRQFYQFFLFHLIFITPVFGISNLVGS